MSWQAEHKRVKRRSIRRDRMLHFGGIWLAKWATRAELIDAFWVMKRRQA